MTLTDIRTNHNVVSINRQAKTARVVDQTGKEIVVPYNALVLSPGAEPVRPPIKGINHPHVMTVRSIPDADAIIERLKSVDHGHVVIVGGGFIGLEMADNLTRSAVRVTLVEATSQVLPSMLDADMAALVHGHLRAHGVSLLLGSPVKSFADAHGGLIVELDNL